MLLSVVDDETILSSVSTPPKPLFILPFSIFYLNSFSLFSQIYELRFIIFIYGCLCLCSFLSHFQHFSMSHANFFFLFSPKHIKLSLAFSFCCCVTSPKAVKSSNLKNDSTIKSKVAITSTHHSLSTSAISQHFFTPALCFAVIFSLCFKGYFIRVIYDFLPPHSFARPPSNTAGIISVLLIFTTLYSAAKSVHKSRMKTWKNSNGETQNKVFKCSPRPLCDSVSSLALHGTREVCAVEKRVLPMKHDQHEVLRSSTREDFSFCNFLPFPQHTQLLPWMCP